MGWNNIVIEGFCNGTVTNGKYPCGQEYPTVFCLENKVCPCFMYSESTEREAAYFVPFRLILWDRFISVWESITSQLSWIFWGQLWFNRRKVQAFFNNIPTVTRDDSQVVAEWEDSLTEANDDFVEWLNKTDKLRVKEKHEKDI